MIATKMLPPRWVDKIFHKLTVAYGRDFLGRWDGVPIEEVKDDWADCLGCFADHGEAIAYGLTNLPDSKAPTAQEFRSVCLRCPAPAPLALPGPPADPVRVAQEMSKLRSTTAHQPLQSMGNKDWARRIAYRIEQGDKTVGRAARTMAMDALGMVPDQPAHTAGA